MRFSLSLPGQNSDFECSWPHIKISHEKGFWNLQTSADKDVLLKLAKVFGLSQTSYQTWSNPETEISLCLISEEAEEEILQGVEDLVEMEMEIPITNFGFGKGLQLQCWGCHIDIDVFGANMLLTIPLQKNQCQNDEIQIHPLDSDRDAVMTDDRIIGYVWKERDKKSPYSQLDGLVNTTGHPFLFHPIWPTLQDISNDTLKSIVYDMFSVDTMEELGEELRFEYLGISEANMSILLAGLTHALKELCGEDLENYLQSRLSGNELEEDEDLEAAQHLLACALFSGTRVARSVYAKSGFDTDIEKTMTSKDARILVEGSLNRRLSFLRISGDERLTRVLSLENRSSLFTASLFLKTVDQQEWNTFQSDELWGWMCWAFDLGVRYQMARVDYQNLLNWAKNAEEDVPSVTDYLEQQGLPDYIDPEEIKKFIDETDNE